MKVDGKGVVSSIDVFETYRQLEETILTVVDKSLLKENSKLALIGGLTINVEGSTDLFLPLKLEIHIQGRVENKLSAFGDPRLQPGCIDFMYLTDMLSEYSTWYRGEVPRLSPFESRVSALSDTAIEVIYSIVENFNTAEDFMKITKPNDLDTDEATIKQLTDYFGGSSFGPI